MDFRMYVVRTVGRMFAASLLVSSFAWAQNSDSVTYELKSGSTYQVGCFPPCLCPLSQELDIRGSFNLSLVGSDPLFDHYVVTAVDWTVLMNNAVVPVVHIVGSGNYTIGGEVAIMHQLELELQVDANQPQQFNSGLVVGGVEFPAIVITVSINDLSCYDTVIVVSALPTGACCSTNAGAAPCFVRTEAECLNQGGDYQGDGTGCPSDPNVPCAAPTGACCEDISDDLIPYESCTNVDQDSCEASGGVFHGTNTSCAQVQACCLSAADLCVELNPDCCIDSGGVPQGAGSTCAFVASQGGCGQVCGGFASVQCPAGEFCKLPTGECCCDFQGVCVSMPDGCVTLWDPVCGCDGVTYGNECDAEAAGVSVNHLGECKSVCEPTNNGFGCVQAPCSVIPEVSCSPTVLHLDITTGAITAVACECFDSNDCHVEFGNATPFPVGDCSDGGNCEVFGTDTNSDGIDDEFTAGCVLSGACCLDAAAGNNSCIIDTGGQCIAQGGTYQGDGTTCPSDPSVLCGAAMGACCSSPNSLSPIPCSVTTSEACAASGGTYQGDNMPCDSDACNCCFADASCTNMPPSVCTEEGGFLRQEGVIPAISQWGLIMMALLAVTAGTIVINRRRPVAGHDLLGMDLPPE